jgi:lipopolysaccharide export system permease protein
VPFSKKQSEILMNQYKGVTTQTAYSQDKASLTLYEAGYLKKMIYAGKLQGHVLEDVSLIEYDKGRFQKITFARKATWLEKDHWQFERGQEHLFFSDDKATLTEFFKKDILLEAQPSELVRFEKNPDDMNLWELSEYIFKQRRSGRDVTKLELKWNEKVAMPFTCLVFMIIGMPMGIRPSRTSSGVGFGLSLLVIIGFYILSAVSRGIGSSGVIPPMIIAWMPNLIAGGIGVQMLIKKAAN